MKDSFLKFGVSLILLLIIHPAFYFSAPNCNLDESWRLAINMSVENNLIFGKDFVFTYGPLGYLGTREVFKLSVFNFLFFDILNIFLLYLLIFRLVTKFLNHWAFYCIFILSALNSSIWHSILSEELPMFYFVIIIFESFYFLENKKFSSIIIITILAIIGTYIKVNYGLIYVLFIFVFALSLGFSKYKPYSYCFFWIFCYLSLLYISSLLLKTDIILYFKNSLYIIDAYNDAMYSPVNWDWGIWYLLFSICVIVAGLFFGIETLENLISKKIKSIPYYSLILLILGLCYVLFKQTVVNGHIFAFPKFFIPLAAPIYFFLSSKGVKQFFVGFLLAISLTFSYYSISFHTNTFGGKEYLEALNPVSWVNKVVSVFNYLNYFKKSSKFDYNSACITFPIDIQQMVAGKTGDIIPWEISAIYTNRMKYSPRPVIQSYSVYHHKLDELNAKKYLSKEAPEYIFFQLHSLGDRNLLFEECKTKLALITNYELLEKKVPDFFATYLIFKRKDTTSKSVEYGAKKKYKIKLNQTISIPETDSLLMMEINWPLTFWGKLKRFLYMPPPLKFEITLENGQKRQFRLVNPVTKGGVFANRFIDYMQNSSEIESFFKYLGDYNKKVKDIKVFCDEEWGVEKESDINIYTVSIKNFEYSKTNYQKVNTSVFDNLPINGQLEYLDTTGRGIAVKGWAMITEQNDLGCCNEISIYSKNNNNFYKIKGHISTKYDPVQKQNLNFNFINSGFSIFIEKNKLPKGENELFLGVTDFKLRSAIAPIGVKINN